MPDWLVIVGAAVAAGLSLGCCGVAYTVVSRWPASPRALLDRMDALEAAESRRIAEFAATIEQIEGLADQVERRTQRLKKQADRAERATAVEQASPPGETAAARYPRVGVMSVADRYRGGH